MKLLSNTLSPVAQMAAATAIFALVLGTLAYVVPVIAQAAPQTGEVNTVTGSCGQPVNANQYEEGQAVLLKGKDFDPNTEYSWDISPAAGGPNAVPIADGTVVTDGNGDFCFTAIPSLPEGSKDDSPYKATVGDVKSDNFSVKASTNVNGTITVVKELVNAPQGVVWSDFSFTVNGGDPVQFDGTDGVNESIQNLNDNPFTIVEVEADGQGYTTSYNGCTSIELTAEGATCTITNTYEPVGPTTGILVVIKEVVSGSSTPSDFTLRILDDQQQEVMSDPGAGDPGNAYELDAGDYTVTEDANPNYTASFASCGSEGAVTVTAGATTTCTVQNREVPDETEPGTITIQKIAAGGEQVEFDFTVDADDDFFDGAFSLFGGASSTRNDILPGSYTFDETAADGWELLDITCEAEGGSQFDEATTSVTVNFEEGDNVLCTFTNRPIPEPELGSITIIKVAGNDEQTEFWFTGDLDDFSLVGSNSSTTVGNLSDNSYEVVEDGAPGWELLNIQCSADGEFSSTFDVSLASSSVMINLAEGEDVTCTFTNRPIPGPGELACSLQASSNPVASGASFDLTWTTDNANFVEITHIGSGLDLDGSTSTSIVSNTTFTLTAWNDNEDSVQCEETVTIRTGGGGGGSTRPQCDAFTLDGDTLSWETRKGRDLTITVDGEEIFSTDDDNVVDEGDLEIDVNPGSVYELTVFRGGKTDTCELLVPEVLGEQVSAVPAGAPNTGAGGAAAPFTHALALFGMLLSFGALRVTRNG